MSSTLPRRAAAVTAIAVTALSGAALAGTASASAHSRHHPTRINSHLSIKAARRTAADGASDTIFGHLGSNGHRLVNQVITLQDRVAGTKGAPAGTTGDWVADGTDKTGKHGDVKFTITPTAKTNYRLVYAGNGNFQPVTSKTVTVNVRNTGLSIKVSATSIDPGASVTVSGVLDANGAPAAGQTVALKDKLVGSKAKYTQVDSQTTGTDGSVSFSETPTGSTRYVLTFATNGDLQAAHSRVVTVIIRKPSSISSRIRSVKAGFVVSGTLRGAGHALRDRTVTLLASTDGGTTYTAVGTHRTDKHALVAFHRNPTVSTEYELAFPGGRYFDACTSPVATATVS